MAIEIKTDNASKLSKENYEITPSADTFYINKSIQVVSLENFIALLKDKNMTLWK